MTKLFFYYFPEPNFVGSFDIGEYVYFFFRETAVEYINCGKAVYSRVARVCKKDTGGKNILSQNWVTYLKARLNCSISGEFPFYFNEIQSVYQIPSDKTKFYATFTTSTNGLVGSAVCSFDIGELHATFKGKFKEQASSNSAWLPVLNSKVPEPREFLYFYESLRMEINFLFIPERSRHLCWGNCQFIGCRH